jgi:hypothetical protein
MYICSGFMFIMAGEEGFEPSHAGIKIQCLNQLGDSPTQTYVKCFLLLYLFLKKTFNKILFLHYLH